MYNRNQFTGTEYKQGNQKRATALGYDAETDVAPRVLAIGRGVIADQIVAIAKANGIPIHEDPVLVEALSNVQINQAIPVELYEIVAEILAYIYRLKDYSLEENE
jgi:flagellar biosynthesis protein